MNAQLDAERQKLAKQYSRIKRRLWVVDTLLGLIYALAWLLTGGSIALRQWLSQITTNVWLLVPLVVAVIGGVYFVIDLPLSYYAGFVLPHRFDQSTQAFKDWVTDQLKGLLISIPLGLLMVELLYWALRAAGSAWWLWAAGGMLLFTILLANLAPIVIMPLFNKFVPLGEEHAELAARLMKLAENAHVKVRGVFKFDMSRRTKSANAALTGIGNTRRIILGDTLINEFTEDEIETVLAHELGHHVHKDIPLLMGFGTLTTLVGLFLASLALDWAVAVFGFTGPSDPAALPALVLVLGAFSLVTMPLENAFSRWRERLADQYSLQSTGKNQAFASAFIRLANQNLSEIDPEAWVVFLFYDHPPLNRRVAMAEQYKASPLPEISEP
ncbi:MAG TPA: M48 family metallopeptidase [Longilinea sp.]|nr:M48 family metallopeptidase [Longilinea sp.]